MLQHFDNNFFKNLHSTNYFFFLIKSIFYKNYKRVLFFRFNLYFNMPLSFFSLKTFAWYDQNLNFLQNYSTLSKFNFYSNSYSLNNTSLKGSVTSLINFKKKLGFFKKDSKLNHFNLYKVNFLKSFSAFRYDTADSDYDFKTFNKFVDLKQNSFLIFYKNRKLFKKLLFIKKLNQDKSTRFFSKILKLNFRSFINFYEFSLINCLIKSNFCSTFKESYTLILKKQIYINGFVEINPFFQLGVGDVIQISMSDNFFNFFKVNLEKKFKSLNTIKHIIWKNHRFGSNFYKQPYNKVPDWVSEISSFYDDIPSHLDVDFTTLSCCVLYKDIDFFSYNYSFINFINIFMVRNYNWNYLT